MSQRMRIHHNMDFQVMHTTPGRIRLKARNLYGRPHSAKAVIRRLSAVQGIHNVEANPTTGSLTMHYHHSALDSVGFFAEVATALGLIAEGIDPDEAEALFNLVGMSPVEAAKSLEHKSDLFPIATFALGLFIGRTLV